MVRGWSGIPQGEKLEWLFVPGWSNKKPSSEAGGPEEGGEVTNKIQTDFLRSPAGVFIFYYSEA